MADPARVLYVDDETSLLELGKVFLEQYPDVSVETVASAQAALDLLSKKTFDAIVSDYRMPEMDGIEFLKHVRRLYKDLPFILFTGRSREEIVIQALNEGADFYLQKGGDPKSQFTELVYKLKKSIAQRQAEREISVVNGEITKKFEEEKVISEFSQVLLNANSVDEVLDYFGNIIFDRSGADYLMLAKLYPREMTVGIHSLKGFGPLLEQIGKLINMAPQSLNVPVDVILAHKTEIPLESGLKELNGGIFTISRGTLPKTVCLAIETILAVKTIFIYELVWEGNLYGSITFGFREGKEILNPSLINTLSNLLANGLWRIYSADAIFSDKHILAESEAKFRIIFENSPYPICINSSPEGKFLEVNAAFLQSSGYTEQEIMGKNPAELGMLSLKDLGRLTSLMVLNGRLENVPMTLIGNGGRRIHVLYSTIPVRINDKSAVMTVTAEITSLRRVEEELLKKNEELEESEKKFRNLYETMAQGIVYHSRDGTIISANPAAERILGLTLDQLMGKTSLDPGWKTIREDGSAFPGTEHPAMVSLRTGTPSGPVIMGVFHPEKNSHVWLSVTAVPRFRPAETTPFQVYTTFDDITKRVRAEEVIRESETSYRGLFNTIRQAIYLLDREGKFIDVNEGAVTMYGYAREEFTGRTPEFLSAPGKNDFPAIAEKIQQAFAGESRKFEFWGLRKNGEIFLKDVWLYKGTYFGEDVVIAIGADISERRQAEEGLRESEKKFAMVFKSNPVSLTLVSATDGIFADINDAFLEHTGYSRNEVIGKTSEELGIFADPDEYEQLVSQLRIRHHVAGKEMRCRVKTGEIRTCMFSCSIILMNGRPHILSSVEDITDRKNAESAFQTMATGMVGTTGMESLDRITESISSWLGADCIMIGEIQPDRKRVSVLAMLLDGKKVQDYEYTLEGTPCEDTTEKGFCLFPDNVASLFPKSRDLRELRIRGYAGIPLRNAEGVVMGVLCILTRNPLSLPPDGRKILDIIAVKAVAEIERKHSEERLTRINEGLLHLGTDHQKNIESLTKLCGELLAADCVLYNKLEGELLCVIGHWHCPPDLKTRDAPEGHICYDVIKGDGNGPLVVTNLPESAYAKSDPNVAAYNLRTYIGHPVRYGEVIRGSLCAVYTRTFTPTLEDLKIIGILSTAVAQEEERKEDHLALRESDERFTAFMSNLPAAAFLKDESGRTLFANTYLQDLLGFKNWKGKTTPELVAGEVGQQMTGADRIALREGPLKIQETMPDTKGVLRTFETIKFPVHFEDKPVLLGGIALDITDRIQAEEALRQSNRKLNLLSGITRHDIKNQLLALTGYLEISRKYLDNPVRTAEFIEKEKRIAGIINNQISFTKVYEDLGVKAPVWQNVSALVKQIITGLPMRDVRIESDESGLEVYADPLLEKVFYNLIENALRYGGEHMTRIRFFTRQSEKELVLFVEDDGGGIPADDKARLFERGFGKNTGLGLFLSREILSITGITITETGEPGKGARFEITMPRGQYRFTGIP